MNKNHCSYRLLPTAVVCYLLLLCSVAAAQNVIAREPAPGVLLVQAGQPDRFTPTTLRAEQPALASLQQLPAAPQPFPPAAIRITTNERGCIVEIPLQPDEQLYGFGMQINSFRENGLRKKPVANDHPLNDVGYTHAPVPMYVSSKGYAVLINTLRYVTFHCGSNPRRAPAAPGSDSSAGQPALSTEALYMSKQQGNGNMIVDVPGARGIEVLVFAGPTLKQAIQRYNLFSGGGALPPLWGLGVKYRVKADFSQPDVLRMAHYFRQQHIACDMLGLEPGWQTASYSCSYVWNRQKFPAPEQLANSLKALHYQLNLWEHAFVNPVSPLYQPLEKRSGDFPVWRGLVPDFADSATRTVFANYHDTALFSKGVTGFKLDECDNSNLATGSKTWSFPECSSFPSGISGEQMHQVFGNLYFRSFYQLLKKYNQRSYFDIRMLGAFASPFPAVLYSDTYEHDAYIRMIANSGFCGLLWSPEVRESGSVTELARRTQTAVLSAQTVFNSWYLKNPPWLQYNTGRNNADSLLPDAAGTEQLIRQLLGYRMQLVPYLYTAFFRYAEEGIPPFRALVVDYPQDQQVYTLSDEYLIGESLLAAPLAGTDSARSVYLPQGNWYDFNTHRKYAGGQTYQVHFGLNQLPVFVKEGSILPLAAPQDYLDAAQPFSLTCYVFGSNNCSTVLFEDDGHTFNYTQGNYNQVVLSWQNGRGSIQRKGREKYRMYKVNKWVQVN
jgi:alpha-D-xyloside xylohydrolase